MAYVVGITGGIGSGKTTVANLFADKGIDIIDADVIARDVVEPGTQGLAAIEAKFGSSVIHPDGTLNRAALREQIFSNPEDKTWLNALLHPMIRSAMIEQTAQANSPYCLLVVPLLVENGLTSLCHRVLVVDVSEETQVRRTANRDGVSEQQVRNIVAAQASREQRRAAADDIIMNEDDADLAKAVDNLHHQYLAFAKQQTESHHE